MKVIIVVVVAAAAAVAGFLAGRLPEYGRRAEVETRLHTAEGELGAARSLLRIHALFDRIQGLAEATSEPPRYDDALTLSTQFFDLVRSEAGAIPDGAARTALAEVLASRDGVTAGLAKHDPGVRALLLQLRDTLHPLLGEAGQATVSTTSEK